MLDFAPNRSLAANDGSIDCHMFRASEFDLDASGWIGNAVKCCCEPASRCLYLKHGVQMD